MKTKDKIIIKKIMTDMGELRNIEKLKIKVLL